MSAVHTIGYQGADHFRLIAALRRAGVRTLVDVRAVPFSRKPGFSKAPLSAALEEAGIGYLSERRLGNPAEGRNAARAGRGEDYRRIFEGHMAGEDAQAGLRQAAGLAADGPVCLMCFEADPAQCHRSIVAAHLCALLGAPVLHLFPVGDEGQPRLL